MFRHEIVVRFNDCDSLGHVNNAVYFTYFEEARSELFRVFNPKMNIRSWNLIAASNRCDYLYELVFAQNITIYTWISRLGTSSFEVEHAIKDENGNWAARGKTILLLYDFENKKSIPLSDKLRNTLLQYSEGPAGVPELRS
ncbi:acyl-CoA thioesterase [Priestia megaterium]